MRVRRLLVEAFDYLTKQNKDRSTKEDESLAEKTLYGKEIKSLAYIIGTMNMILHGVEAPNIRHMNTLCGKYFGYSRKGSL